MIIWKIILTNAYSLTGNQQFMWNPEESGLV